MASKKYGESPTEALDEAALAIAEHWASLPWYRRWWIEVKLFWLRNTRGRGW